MVSILVGGQWGDEGKGKIVSYLCLKDNFDITARAGVGPNAGHTVEYRGEKYGLRLVPSGFLTADTRLLIGAGVLVNPEVILKEINDLKIENRIGVDKRCGIIEKDHIERDKGSSHLKETPVELNSAIAKGKKILIECSQGFGLSLFYGTYPFVTSKDTNAAQACVDVGIGPRDAKEVIVVFKSYPSRVGEGPFPTALKSEESERLGIVEYGTVTGRRRRSGRFDFEMAKNATMINSASQIALTCVDYIDMDVRGVKEYSRLTEKVKKFIDEVEKRTDVPVTLVSTGPDLSETIDLREEKL
jgi:adenylosuccinate synthase